MREKHFLRFAIFTLSYVLIQTLSAKEFAGIDFSSETPRTSISIFEKTPRNLSGQFAISFNLSLEKSLSIGQIFTLDSKNIPLSLTYIGRDDSHYMLVLSSLTDKNKYIAISLNNIICRKGIWNNIKLEFSTTKQSATLSIDNQSYELKNIPVPATDKYNFIFGPNQIALSDAPSMAISNIRIYENSNELYHFPLNESSGNVATDIIQNAQAEVINPIWLINDHHYWKKTGEYNGSVAAGIAYDNKRGRVVIINEDSVILIGMRDNTVTSVKNEKKLSFKKISGEVHYNASLDSLYFYNLTDEQNVTHPFVVSFSADGKMGNFKAVPFTNPLHHHAHFFDEHSNTMYIFGGYGNFIYSDKMYTLSNGRNNWTSFVPEGDKISPRMHTIAGKGRNDHEYFIFGGVGNVSGKQELGKDFFFDLYSFDTRTEKIKKLWSDNYPDSILIPKRNLIYNKEEDKIYALCCVRSIGQIALYAIDPSSAEISKMSDNAIVNTNSIYSSAYLFYDEETEQFVMVARQSDEARNNSTIVVYTLNTPVLPDKALHNNVFVKKDKPVSYISISVTLACLLLLAGFLIRHIKRRPVKPEVLPIAGKEHHKPADQPETAVNESSPSFDNDTSCKVNAIYLFGEFCIYDRKGIEITYRFTSKIKQMLALFMLNSGPGQNGLSSETLSLTLWSNKTVADSKNIRGVTINHLRKLLNDINGISLVFENNRWRLATSEPLYCDYLDIAHIYASDQLSDNECASIINIFKRGDLLPSFYQYDWFTNRKIEYDEHIFQLLEKAIPLLFSKKQYKEVIFLSDKLSSIDNLNENALKYKMAVLNKSGKPDMAELTFEKFRKEYTICYNTAYDKSSLSID